MVAAMVGKDPSEVHNSLEIAQASQVVLLGKLWLEEAAASSIRKTNFGSGSA
jgi:hypothetical protein